LELATFVPEKKEEILNYAKSIIRELSTKKYLAKEGDNGGFILKHSVGNIHEDNETDTALNYADYYFLETLVRWNKIND
jgi:vacuolar-type H+-ATPase subunit E/Vma4